MVRSPLSFLFPVLILLLRLVPTHAQGYKPAEAAGKMVVPDGLTVKLFASRAGGPPADPRQVRRPRPALDDPVPAISQPRRASSA